ncbi:hypothetical protein LINGRAHAP2_LOCUS27446 [Linum grandiflorum]
MYSKSMLSKFNMGNVKPSNKPIPTSARIGPDDLGKAVNEKLYRGMISSLLYLMANRPDISFSVGLCAKVSKSTKRKPSKSSEKNFTVSS